MRIYKNFNVIFLIYLVSLLALGIFYLHLKHTVGNDSTISDWIINYQGGFTRRGLIGEICFHIAKFFDQEIRFIIFLFQSLIYSVFISLIYLYFKNLPKNLLSILAIFTPIFLIYPIAELEVLVRKEVFVFIAFIVFLNLSSKKYSKNLPIIYSFLIFPIICLIWEPFIFFLPFAAFIIVVRNHSDKIKKILIKLLLSFSTSIFVTIYILMNIMNEEQHALMVDSLLKNFGENCYVSCATLLSQSSVKSQFMPTIERLSFTVFLRYFLIILIGFGPLFILYFNSQLKKKVILFSFFNNLFFPLLIICIPILLLFAAALDWGRWVNISYTFSILLYFYLQKNNLIIVNSNIIFLDNYYLNNKKMFIFIFFIFAFYWNQKTIVTGDVATNTLYKIIYRTSKNIFNFSSIRLFEDSPLLEFHKKYIE